MHNLYVLSQQWREVVLSSTRPNVLKEATTSLGKLAGTLHTVTRILVPMYSGWSLKNLVVTPLSASLAACSFICSSTSQVAKLRQQKYCPWMPAVRHKFLESILLQARKSPRFDVYNKRDNAGFQSVGYLRDWRNNIALKIWGILTQPIPIIFFRAFL